MAYKTEIFAKAVPSIRHDGHDHYYRSLIRLSPGDLAKMLAENLHEKDDSWFRKFVKEHEADAGTSSDDDNTPRPSPRPRLPGVDAIPIPAPVALVDCEYVPLTRQIVALGGGDELKVYFDNMTHRSGLQQGWLTCLVHRCTGCIRWRRVTVEDPAEYFAYMYCWHQDAVHSAAIPDKDAHMAYEPDLARVRDIASQLTLRQF